MPKGRPKKDPFDCLDAELKAAVDVATDEDIRVRISAAALNMVATQQALKEDQDVAEKKLALQEAQAGYKEAIKYQRTFTQYCRQILTNRGKEAGTAFGK